MASKNWWASYWVQGGSLFALGLMLLLSGYVSGCARVKRYTPVQQSLLQGKQLLQDGQLDEAIRHLEQAVAAHPTHEGHQLLGLAYQKKSQQLSAKSIAAYKAAISAPGNALEARLNLGDIYYEQGKYTQAIEVLQPLTDKADGPPAAWRKLALAYLKDGQLNQSLAAWEHLHQLNPDDVEVEFYRGLIKEQKDLYEEALEYYQRVISLKPESRWAEEARQHLDAIEARSGVSTLAGIENKEVRQLIENAPGAKEYPNAGAIILLDEISYIVHENHTMTTKIHRLVKILNERGQDFGEVKLDYDSSHQTVNVDFARTIRQDGRVVNVGKKSMRDLTPWAGFPLYSNVKVRVISMPEVVEGSIIEYSATIESSEMINEDDFQFSVGLQSYEPQLLQRIILDIPQNQPLKIHYVRLEDSAPRIEHKAGRQIYTWEIRNTPEIISEPLMPPWADISPFIMVSSFESWNEVSHWFQELAKDQFQVDEAIRQKVAQLIADAPDKQEMARRIFHFVAGDIRYVGLEYGVSGYKPHKAAEIFKNKYGDCKDQATLLVSMLREAGIPACLVLLSTHDNGKLEEEIPMSQFNHCIAVARLGEELFWLDPTYETCSFGYVPAGDQQRQALVMFDEGARFVTTPLIEPAANKILKEVELEIKADGSVDGTSKLITAGIYDMSYRGLKYSKPIKRRHMLQSLVNSMYPGGKLLDYSISDLDDMDERVTINMSYTGPAYLKSAGDLRLFQLPGVGSSASAVSREKRNYPIQFSHTSWMEIHTTIKIPPKYKVRYLPEEIKLELPYAAYWSRYENRDGVIHYFERNIIKDTEIAVTDYQEYKTYREKIAQETDKQIILEVIN
jgi:tetratricopeptide (TPR) repeat protein